MSGDPSFYYSIFKRLQATAASNNIHINDDTDDADDFAGGFSLKYSESTFGIFTHLGPQALGWKYCSPGMKPLNDNSLVPAENPMWAILDASLESEPLPHSIEVGNEEWPVMPAPLDHSIATFPEWLEFNQPGTLRLIDALGTWIEHGKVNDTPKGSPIDTASPRALPKPIFPAKSIEKGPILFVCSRKGDDGRRAGDGLKPDPPAVPVPANFWATSQIFLTDTLGNLAQPANLVSGGSYYVVAVIGNSAGIPGGRMGINAGDKIVVQADALAFNTFMGPNVPLASAGELDSTSTNPIYEQFYIGSYGYDTVGFRFDVDDVFERLVNEVAMVRGSMLGGVTPDQWVRDSHPCVKIRIMAGETLPRGYSPGAGPPSISASPVQDRHIALRHLKPFSITPASKKPSWEKFIVAQAATGVNTLSLQHDLPLDVVGVTLAIPRLAWERYIDPATSRGGAVRGFEMQRDAGNPPFPGDTVFLRQTDTAAQIHVADHADDEYFGMALGLEGDPARLEGARATEISMAHADASHRVVGGFTLHLVSPPASGQRALGAVTAERA